MDKIRKCKCCGKEFAPQHSNQKYCSNECQRQGKRESYRRCILAKEEKKNAMKCKAPNVTMEQVLDAMNRLSQKYGRFVQYREVQVGLDTGKLKVKGGVIVE